MARLIIAYTQCSSLTPCLAPARAGALHGGRARALFIFFFSLSLSLLARASIVRMLRLHLLTRRRPLHERWRPLLPCAILLRASRTRMPATVLFSRTRPCCCLEPPGSRSLTPNACAMAARVAFSMPPSPASSAPSARLAPRSSPPLHPQVLAQSLHRKR
jgi:hypothetical protein